MDKIIRSFTVDFSVIFLFRFIVAMRTLFETPCVSLFYPRMEKELIHVPSH